MLSKEKFIKVITDLKDLCDRIDLVDLALKQISSDFCGLYIPQVLDITVGVLEEVFEDTEKLLQNAPSKDDGMFHIPKVIN